MRPFNVVAGKDAVTDVHDDAALLDGVDEAHRGRRVRRQLAQHAPGVIGFGTNVRRGADGRVRQRQRRRHQYRDARDREGTTERRRHAVSSARRRPGTAWARPRENRRKFGGRGIGQPTGHLHGCLSHVHHNILCRMTTRTACCAGRPFRTKMSDHRMKTDTTCPRARSPHAREVRRLSTLLEVSQALSGTLNLKASLHRVLEILARHHGAVRGIVSMLARGRRACASRRPTASATPRVVRYRIGEGITGKVVQSGKPIVVPRVSREPAFLHRAARRPELSHQELSFVCVPIILNRRAIGALAIDLKFKAERNFERSTKFLGVVASMIAQAVKIHRLIEEDKRKLVDENTHLRQELRERYDFSNLVGSSGPDAADLRAGDAGRGHQHDRADPRRVGDRQGADRARHPLQLAARQEAVRQGQLRGAARQPDRVGALRLREGRVHRAPNRGRKAASSWPRAARCSSTRSATSTSPRR